MQERKVILTWEALRVLSEERDWEKILSEGQNYTYPQT